MVCDATQHAHQALVVHRDLKPSNIFVSRAGEVKLLDFGIAKLLEPDHPLADRPPELRALTPAYAAPEQIRGEPVTTAADVYVLGAVLYELLTGHGRAGRAGRRSRDAPIPARRASRSARWPAQAAAGTPSTLAAARRRRRPAGPSPGGRHRPRRPQGAPARAGRRYGSAGQLADDVQRLLDGRPVMAQPDTRGYRMRRFVGRHRVATPWLAVVRPRRVVCGRGRMAGAGDRGRARSRPSRGGRAERVSLLVTDLFKLAEPAAGRGARSARASSSTAGTRDRGGAAGDPETQAALFNAIARVYGNLGLHDAAIGVLQRALDREHAVAEGTLARAETLHLLGERHASKNDYASAERFPRGAGAAAPAACAGTDVAATLEGLGRTLNATAGTPRPGRCSRTALAMRRREPGAPERT